MENNRFYKITNPKEKQFTTEYINLDDISSVHLPNESMNLGIVVMKTGKDIYVHREELDKIISRLTVVNSGFWCGKPISDLSPEERLQFVKYQTDFLDVIYEPDKNYFPGK